MNPRGPSPCWQRSPPSTRCSRSCACARSRQARPVRRRKRSRQQLPRRRAASAEPSLPSAGACSRSAGPSSCWCWRRWSTASIIRSHISTRSCARSRSPSSITISANSAATSCRPWTPAALSGWSRKPRRLPKGASRSTAAMPSQPIFNPVGGYASYIVPAAFVLILQQMLLIGASMLTVVALAQTTGGAFATVLGRGIAHLTIYLPALALYFIVLPRFYGFSTLGHPVQLFALASLFTLATSFMGQAAGAWFRQPETPTLIFLGTSLPQLFVT